MGLNIKPNEKNILDSLEITPEYMREFLTMYNERVLKGQNEVQIIIWMYERSKKDKLFEKCVLLSATIGAAAAYTKIHNATEQFIKDIKKKGD
jgi:uncharacterized protein YueI